MGKYPFIRVGDVKDIVNYDDCIKIPEEILPAYPTLKKVDVGDIVLTKGGSIGIAGYITKPACVSRDLIFINSSVLPESKGVLLYLYLSTKFAYKQFIRSSSQCAQPHLTTTLIKNFDVYNFTNEFANIVLDKYNEFIGKLELSKQLYQEAEVILLDELGLKNWEPTNQTSTVKSFADFIESGRLDAEYYQPKYDEIESKISRFDSETISKLFEIQNENFTPKDNEQYQYIELSNIGSVGEITDCTYEIGSQLPSRARRIVKTGDIIVSSIEGSLESCAIITEEYNNAICSTGFYVLTSKSINAETALILFKTNAIQQLMKKVCSGTILTAMNTNEFAKIKLPVINKDLQMQIADKVQKSFGLRTESKHLLDLTKTAVETAIEQGEQAATELLKFI